MGRRQGNEEDSTAETLERIQYALEAASAAISGLEPSTIKRQDKPRGAGPVTEADHVANRVLREVLQREGEGWFSEETVDDHDRLDRQRVWIVDPIDGTREFIAGVPEWCISVGLVENGRAVAGGIFNPSSSEIILGSLESGVTYNGRDAAASQRKMLTNGVVLASRSEVNRGEWESFRQLRFHIRPTGSIAYKLGLVGAGLADATWTVSPKHEWDVAAGVALVEAGGGFAWTLEGVSVKLNNPCSRLPGIVACGPYLKEEVTHLLGKPIGHGTPT